ncbi:MAG: AraC family transcriptional regulator ligand-binding domain-containing protein, partial [Rhodobacteraceae bacterium]|nr:AraC family transcriptional regulator ligand-binding domain-containing protein [Paracoccaceae bacterium]
MKRGSVAAGLVRGFVDFAESRGAVRAGMLAALGPAAERLADPDARVPLDAYRAAIRAAAESSGDPAILLRYSCGTKLQEVSIVGLIVHSCASMAESMAQLNRYSRLMVEVDVMPDGPRFAVEPGAGGLWLIDRRPDPDSLPELTESGFGRFIGEFRREFGVPMARELRMTHAEPAHGALVREILGVPVVFAAERNAMLMDPEWLAIEYDEGDRSYVFGIFAEKADRLM